MTYRTKTYIAGDWTGDKDLIDQLYKWNDSDHWALSFTDAHELMQSSDNSLSCSIKKSLSMRLDASKTFVLVVGDQTDKLTKGGCQYCHRYSSYYRSCNSGMHVDYRSFIQYECEKASRDGLKIVILYNSTRVEKSKCPEVLRSAHIHVAAQYKGPDGKLYWKYQDIKKAI